MNTKRQDHEPPLAIREWGRRYLVAMIEHNGAPVELIEFNNE
jgi:hypothetical protein